MTSMSYLWNCPGGAGDGLNSLTRADWSTISKIFSACNGPEGVAPGYLNELAGTVTGANTVSINSGGGLCDGKPYNNDAALAVNIPSAVGAGNQRKDRIVLRTDWPAQTVRIFRIAGTDAAAPVAPATSQVPGTLYDVPLYVATVNPAGTVTLADERWFAQAVTNGIRDANVTLAKMAPDSVDDTKAGNRVPALIKRQGGSATNWSTPGITNYTPGMVRMQCGVVNVHINAGASFGSNNVAFPVPFSQVPIPQLTSGLTGMIPNFNNLAVDSMAVSLMIDVPVGVAVDVPVSWLVIGTE
jgi:hypothetical protein